MTVVPLLSSFLGGKTALVSCWPMEGNSNDGKGTNNGTDTNITYSTANGKFAQGAGGNGTSSEIAIADSATLKITGPLTVSAWVKSSAATRQNLFQCFNGTAGVYGGYRLELKGDTGQALFLVGKNTGTPGVLGTDYQRILSTSTTVNDGAYHWIVGVYDGSFLKLYLDGVPGATNVTWTGNPAYQATNYIKIGDYYTTENGAAQWWFNGAIDDVAVFNAALTDSEIANYWNGSGSLLPLLGVG